jgi:folate-binding protein YgfZ
VTTTALEWACIEIAGEDASSYLEGQLSQSVASLGHGKWTCILDPSSVVISSAWIRGAEERYELLVPALRCELVLARLKRFVLRVRVTMTVTPAHDVPMTSLQDLADQEWPWVAEYERDLTPHSFGSHFVAETISFSKGCYTGQELVGRMDARGATMPWRFAVVTGPTLDEIAASIDAYGPLGPKGITTVLDADAVTAFAIVHRTALSGQPSDATVHIRAVS